MTATRKSQKLGPGLYASVLLVCGLLGFVHLRGGAEADSLQLFARHTARVSFTYFLLVFVARPLKVLNGGDWGRRLARSRRQLGLAFALAHFIHLGALVSFFVFTETVPDPIAIAFGGLGYLLLAALTLTSNDQALRLLGRNWRRLHRVGLYYLWFIFVQSYAGRVFASGAEAGPVPSPRVVYVLLLSTALVAMGLRFFAHRRGRGLASAG